MHVQHDCAPPRNNKEPDLLTLRCPVIGPIRTWQARPCGTYDPICYNNINNASSSAQGENAGVALGEVMGKGGVTSQGLGSVIFCDAA